MAGPFVPGFKRLCSRSSEMLYSQRSVVLSLSEPLCFLRLPPLDGQAGLAPPQAASLCHYSVSATFNKPISQIDLGHLKSW